MTYEEKYNELVNFICRSAESTLIIDTEGVVDDEILKQGAVWALGEVLDKIMELEQK